MGLKVSLEEYVHAREQQVLLRRQFEHFFSTYDILLTPTTLIPAPFIDGPSALEQARLLTRFTSPFNLTGLPAMSIPCGFTSGGLPVGLQIVSAPWREAAILRAGLAYEQATQWYKTESTGPLMKTKAYFIFLVLEAAGSFLFSMIFTASSVYQVTVAGLSPLQLVLVGTTLEIAIFVFEIPTGVVADVYSRKLSIIIGWLLVGLGFLVEGSFPWFGPILLAQLIWGIGYTFTSGATQAWITDEIGEASAGKAFIRANQVGVFAALLGTVAGMALRG